MSRLTAKQRDSLPDSAFAGSGRTFPVNDANHAHAALALIGHAPPAARAKIRARAHEMLGEHTEHNDAHHAKARVRGFGKDRPDPDKVGFGD